MEKQIVPRITRRAFITRTPLAAQGMLQAAAGMRPEKRTIGIGAARLGEFGPVVDGRILPAHPFDPAAPEIARNKPLMVGWNEDEYTFFGMVNGDLEAFSLDEAGLARRLEKEYGPDAARIFEVYRQSRPEASPADLYVAIKSMLFAGRGSIRIAERKAAQNGAPVFLYNFGYKSEYRIPGTGYAFGSGHAMDIQFKFANVAEPPPGETEKGWPGNRPERFAASFAMAELWTTFARTGVPAARNQPAWPPYALPERPTFRIDSACEVILDRHREERELWDSLD
ncbi:MAG TPA: carboxylesterase family protein [bacterium]|nr:carboxylesterase family protein [bacterium]